MKLSLFQTFWETKCLDNGVDLISEGEMYPSVFEYMGVFISGGGLGFTV